MNKKLVILLSGKMGSGKNTVAQILKEELEKEYDEKVVLDAFARPLKQMCQDSFQPLIDFLNEIFTDLLREKKLESYSYKEVESWITKPENWWEEKTPISRIVLQQVGTQIFRNHVDENYWVELFKKNARERPENITICTDLRFPGEIEYVEFLGDMNVVNMRIEREMDRTQAFNEHISEKALDDYKDWDIIIRNDGTLEDLRKEIQILVKDRMFIKAIK